MNDIIKESFARVALQWATDPYAAEQTYIHLFGETPTPINYIEVERVLGYNAAIEWQKIVDATTAFYSSVYKEVQE